MNIFAFNNRIPLLELSWSFPLSLSYVTRFPRLRPKALWKCQGFLLVKKNSKNSKVLKCSLLQCYLNQGKPYHPKHKSKNVLWYYSLHEFPLETDARTILKLFGFIATEKLQVYILSLIFLEILCERKFQNFEEICLIIRKKRYATVCYTDICINHCTR
jgi:hypothetical protein